MRFLIDIAGDVGRRIPVRLVKGAYWDSEVKWAQEQGLESYPVFTRKSHSDISYLAAARAALDAGDKIYAQFATHNAHTLASILHYAGSRRDYEFQRLHGMGEELYAEVVDPQKHDRPCRVYAPVGNHEDLLPYLVRRLLENGSNTSFVNKIADEAIDVMDIVADPLQIAAAHDYAAHDRIPTPADIFQPERDNSHGVNLADRSVSNELLADLEAASRKSITARPIIGGKEVDGKEDPSVNPTNTSEVVGICHQVSEAHIDTAIELSVAGQASWDRLGAEERARILNRAGDLYEEHTDELIGLLYARVAGPFPTRSRSSARRSTSCATTVRRRRSISASRSCCRVRQANATPTACAARACSLRSAPGTSRWRSSRARLRRHSRRATRCWPNRRHRRH